MDQGPIAGWVVCVPNIGTEIFDDEKAAEGYSDEMKDKTSRHCQVYRAWIADQNGRRFWLLR